MNVARSDQSKTLAANNGTGPAETVKRITRPLAAFALLFALGLAGWLLRADSGPVYMATARVVLPAANSAHPVDIADPRRAPSVLRAAAPGGARPGDRIVIARDPDIKTTYSITATAGSPDRAVKTADSAASFLVKQNRMLSKILSHLSSTPAPSSIAEVSQRADDAGAQVSPDSSTTPAQHMAEMTAYLAAMGTGGAGVLVLTLLPFVSARRKQPLGEAAQDGADAAQAPVVHTLVTVSPLAAPPSGYILPTEGEIVLTSGDEGAPRTLPPVRSEPSSFVPLSTEIDGILFDRLDEYKAYRPNEGCVLLVTETNQIAPPVGSYLNGAAAALSIARSIAERRATPTLLIDTGSSVWTVAQSARSAKAPDVVELPDAPGVYDVLAGRETLDACVLVDDDVPGLMAIGPGVAPPDWPEVLRSERMRALIASSRALADLIIIYAPRCMERPETVRVLGEFTNGIMVVSSVDPVGRAAEAQALAILADAGAVLFGRIALDQTEARAPQSDTPQSEPVPVSEQAVAEV